jgi:hypothetical protein
LEILLEPENGLAAPLGKQELSLATNHFQRVGGYPKTRLKDLPEIRP